MAGVFLIVQGAHAPPDSQSRRVVLAFELARERCLAGSLVGPFFASPRRLLVFLAGVLNGFLPCGLVYGYLALASSTASLPLGLATMATFGAGTVPVMVLTGVGALAFSLTCAGNCSASRASASSSPACSPSLAAHAPGRSTIPPNAPPVDPQQPLIFEAQLLWLVHAVHRRDHAERDQVQQNDQ